MARSNKYTSINFNHILEKNLPSSATNANTSKTNPQHPSSSSFASYSSISSFNNNPNNLYKNHLPTSRTHGRMLVLTRPAPKPITPPVTPVSTPPAPQTHPQTPQVSDQTRSASDLDEISLRPLGRTGTGSVVSCPLVGQEREKEVVPVVASFKPDRFVPPHLRPGFAGKEERPGPEVSRTREQGQRQHQQGYFGSPGRYGEDGRPKSGGYERMRKGGESDLGSLTRPRSSGNRPSSSG